MTRGKWIGICCRAAVLAMAASIAWGALQDQANPSARRTWREPSGYTVAEYNAYQPAHLAKNPADRLKLLNDFVAGYPTSSLVPFAYQEYYELYLSQRTYPKAIEYLDKLIPLDETDLNARLSLLVMRAQAFLMGCDASELRTPEAYVAARNAAVQGQPELSRLQKTSPMMADEQFAAMKKDMGLAFDSVTQIAESALKGDQGTCKPPPVTAPSDEELQKAEKERSERYDRIIQDLLNEQKQTPAR